MLLKQFQIRMSKLKQSRNFINLVNQIFIFFFPFLISQLLVFWFSKKIYILLSRLDTSNLAYLGKTKVFCYKIKLSTSILSIPKENILINY